jgi:hypothetical protein
VAAGYSFNGANHDFALARYLADIPLLSIADATLTEGDSGTANMTFTVSLAGAGANDNVTAQYATASDSATGTDYVAKSGTVQFLPGQISKTITVAIKGDLIDEPNESFFVNLSNAQGATIDNGTATGTIVDNDPVPGMSVSDVTVTEGNSGTTGASFIVSLSNPSSQYVTFDYDTDNGTAVAGSDYKAKSGTKVFLPGQITKTVTVSVIGETAQEPNETFFLNLADADNAVILDGQGVGTITDDDRPTISINDAQVTEGTSGTTKTMTFTVTLSKAGTSSITVQYATANDTAVAPGDYTAKSGTLTFSVGQVSKPITVTIKGDNVAECTESFVVNLSNATNASIADGQGVGTIVTDEPNPCD